MISHEMCKVPSQRCFLAYAVRVCVRERERGLVLLLMVLMYSGNAAKIIHKGNVVSEREANHMRIRKRERDCDGKPLNYPVTIGCSTTQ